MDDWKQIVAGNLSACRKQHGLTQLQLAELLHYSDKAVSKWERGESMPDLAVMKQLADFYGMSIDSFLLTPEQRAEKTADRPEESAASDASLSETAPDTEIDSLHEPEIQTDLRQKKRNRLIIAGMAAMLVWLIATLIFVVLDAVLPEMEYAPFLFIYAAPITAVVVLVFNSIWFNRRWNFVIISLLVWSLLGALFLTFYLSGIVIWKLFVIGIPAQLIILLWSRLKPSRKLAE
ncbi:MAG: helix-turn-helix transcriptional regulator [Oscillospiraceae bacterium]|nr:helix-turn-helix transcriptional regulator [Oscillospiraceae bacterium]